MAKENKSASNLDIGMLVEINPRSDRTRKQLISGRISEILTNNKNHPHGILVKLETGEIGRVKSDKVSDLKSSPNYVDELSKNNESAKIDIKTMVMGDESHVLEFKENLLWSSKYTKEDIDNHPQQSPELRQYGKSASKFIVAKSIVAFMNADGGNLIIGVKEHKDTKDNKIIGIEHEFDKIKNNQNEDGYRLELNNLIDTYFPADIRNHLTKYIKICFEKINALTICVIYVSRAEEEIFLQLKETDKNKNSLFVKNDARIKKYEGVEMVNYIKKHFKSK